MNLITAIVATLTLWLVMGLGFLSKLAKVHRNGNSFFAALKSKEGLLFVFSLFVPLIVFIYRGIS